MQNTLLGVAIALILALVAALAGPYFIDWTQHRAAFEVEAARIVGLPVRVGGGIEARLLPTPTLRLRDIAVGARGEAPRLTAGGLDVEFSLGALLRGEWRAAELNLSETRLALGLDASGRLNWPAGAAPFNLGGLSVDRLHLTGQAQLTDAASGAALTLSEIRFTGDVRPQTGALRGDGHLTANGHALAFRVSSALNAGGAGTRLRLALEPAGADLVAEIDGVLSAAASAPRLEGTVQVAQGREKRSGQMLWQLNARMTADSAGASFENLSIAVGGDEGGLKGEGEATVRFGAQPQAQARVRLNAPEVERALAAFGVTAATPREALNLLLANNAAMPRPPLPFNLSVSGESLSWSGRLVQNLRLEASGNRDGWTLARAEAMLPGAARMTWRDDMAAGASSLFEGVLGLAVADSAQAFGWFNGTAASVGGAKPSMLSTRLAVTPQRIAFERARVEYGDVRWDGEGAFDRTAFTGAAEMRANFSSSVAMTDWLAPLAPEAAEYLRSVILRNEPHAVRANVAVSAADAAGPAKVTTQVVVDAASEALEAKLSAPYSRTDTGPGNLAAAMRSPQSVELHLRQTPRVVSEWLGLGGVVVVPVGKSDVRIAATRSATTSWQGTIAVRGDGLELEARGSADFNAAEGTSWRGDIDVRDADVARLVDDAPTTAGVLPVKLRAALQKTVRQITLSRIEAEVMGSRVSGELQVSRDEIPQVTGALRAETLDVGRVVKLTAGATGAQTSAPLARGLAGAWRGRIALAASEAQIGGGIALQALQTTLAANPDEVTFEDVRARTAEDEISGRLRLRRSSEGMTVMGEVRGDLGDASRLRYRAVTLPAGAAKFQMTLEGRGRSAAALVGALAGHGEVEMAALRVPDFDPGAFAEILRARGAGGLRDAASLKDFAAAALARGPFESAAARIPFKIAAGRLQIERSELAGVNGRLIVQAGYDFASGGIDGRATLTGLSSAGDAAGASPEVTVFWHGDAGAPVRTLDVSALAAWLTLRGVEQESRRLQELQRNDAVQRPLPAQPSPPANLSPVIESPALPASSVPATDPAPLPPPVTVTAPPGAKKSRSRAPIPLLPRELQPPSVPPPDRAF